MKKELKGVDSNTGVHCPTEELAKQVLNIAHDAGYAWCCGLSYIDDLKYSAYRGKTTYSIVEGEIDNLTYYEKEGYKVITAEEFIKLNSNMKKKEEVYISITEDNVVDVARLLEKAGERLYDSTDLLAGNTKGYNAVIKSDFDDSYWVRTNKSSQQNKTEVTIEELAEILGVKPTFKVGDRVRIKSTSDFYRYNSSNNPRCEGTIIEDECYTLSYESYAFNARVKWDTGNTNCYNLKRDLELVTEATPVKEKPQTLKISRENLAKIYVAVCTKWQQRLNAILEKTDKFSNEVELELETVLEGYNQASAKQIDLLRAYLPLPKVKVQKTVEVGRWFNVYADGLSRMYYSTKELAFGAKSNGRTYIDTIELKGSYIVEQEQDMEYGTPLPF